MPASGLGVTATFLPPTDIITKIRKVEEEKRKATDEELLELQ